MSTKSVLGVKDQGTSFDMVFLVLLIDTTKSSIARGFRDILISGGQGVITAMREAKNHAVTQVALIGMGGQARSEFEPLDTMAALTVSDFPASEDGSPIADRLGSILENAEQLVTESYNDPEAPTVKYLVLLATDGVDARRTDDNRVVRASRNFSDGQVETMLRRLSNGKDLFIRAIAIGDDDDGKQAEAALICLGFTQSMIIPSKASPSDIRRAFDEMTRSSLKAAS